MVALAQLAILSLAAGTRGAKPSRTPGRTSSDSDWRSPRATLARKHRALYEELAQSSPTIWSGSTEGSSARPVCVLAPAGGWPQLRAAVAAGADAVYFGSDGLNARARASNFSPHELGEVMEFLHARGVEGYMCINVLVFDDELDGGEPNRLIEAARDAGVDAVIVQDLAVARLVRQIAPTMEIHASTQMSVADGFGALHAVEMAGANTVVVGRELSVEEIATVPRQLVAEGHGQVGVEAFVHGALCVSYSGQCFSSEAWGGRSANRGQCAQACRMPYGLVVDGELSSLVDESYLLSPQDLCGIDHVERLVKAGVRTLKIEGRLKGPEYVYATVRAYRAAVDEAVRRSAALQSKPTRALDAWTPTSKELAQIFARAQDAENDGLSSGFLDGSQHQTLVRATTPGHRGVLVATVAAGESSVDGAIRVRLREPVRRGDGVCFGEPALYESGELGGNVYDILDPVTLASTPPESQVIGDAYLLVLGHEVRTGSRRRPRPWHGQLVWRTNDPVLNRAIGQRLGAPGLGRELITVELSGCEGTHLQVRMVDSAGRKGEGRTKGLLQPTRSGAGVDDHGDDALVVAATRAIGTLGDSPLAVGEVDARNLAKSLYVAAKVREPSPSVAMSPSRSWAGAACAPTRCAGHQGGEADCPGRALGCSPRAMAVLDRKPTASPRGADGAGAGHWPRRRAPSVCDVPPAGAGGGAVHRPRHPLIGISR